jgi:hypothetical protein
MIFSQILNLIYLYLQDKQFVHFFPSGLRNYEKSCIEYLGEEG